MPTTLRVCALFLLAGCARQAQPVADAPAPLAPPTDTALPAAPASQPATTKPARPDLVMGLPEDEMERYLGTLAPAEQKAILRVARKVSGRQQLNRAELRIARQYPLVFGNWLRERDAQAGRSVLLPFGDMLGLDLAHAEEACRHVGGLEPSDQAAITRVCRRLQDGQQPSAGDLAVMRRHPIVFDAPLRKFGVNNSKD
jgi:hypothetical protein